MSDQTHLEERIAHLTRMVEDLSDVVARQENELARIKKQAALLIEREVARGEGEGGSIPLGDQRPPHW